MDGMSWLTDQVETVLNRPGIFSTLSETNKLELEEFLSAIPGAPCLQFWINPAEPDRQKIIIQVQQEPIVQAPVVELMAALTPLPPIASASETATPRALSGSAKSRGSAKKLRPIQSPKPVEVPVAADQPMKEEVVDLPSITTEETPLALEPIAEVVKIDVLCCAYKADVNSSADGYCFVVREMNGTAIQSGIYFSNKSLQNRL